MSECFVRIFLMIIVTVMAVIGAVINIVVVWGPQDLSELRGIELVIVHVAAIVAIGFFAKKLINDPCKHRNT